QPEWNDRLGDTELKGLDADARQAVLLELLPELEWHARDLEELWGRLDRLKSLAGRASEASWRLEVRRAALLRMRSVLVGIAGKVLLGPIEPSGAPGAQRTAQRDALEGILSCEAIEPGVLPTSRLARAPLPEPFPPLARELELLEEVLPSWLGVRFRPAPESVRAERGLLAGATQLQAVYPDSPAREAGLEVGDIVLGTPDRLFDAPGQLREWTMISPRQAPLDVLALRPGVRPEDDQELAVTLFLRALPMEWPELPGPPKVGDVAPPLPSGLAPVGYGDVPTLAGQPHLLFFWATWCLPCKKAVPEVMAYAAAKGLSVLAISDEESKVVAEHLEKRDDGFFDQVAVDPLRKSFISWGVSGTPTIVMVDEKGVVRHRQVGYKPSEGLSVDGWSWSGS
ncbi:MAG: redoxin family protein, partial [Acidobacteriota bacterium]|nr:redoxin family protein [Acidobacteriota bacterium]